MCRKTCRPSAPVKSSMANRIVGLNVVGLRRAGFSPTQRKEIKQAFNMLYRSNLSVARPASELTTPFRRGPRVN